MRYLLATHNPGKVRELKSILSGLDIVCFDDIGVFSDPEENGASFRENALIKARAACAASGLAALADDSGLVIDALDGKPGIHSARFAPVGQRKKKVLELMHGKTDRKAAFVCCAVCVFPDGREIFAEGRLEGEIAGSPKGSNGFGYDPIFFLRERGMTLAEISEEDKNNISHRRQAFERLGELLKEDIK